MHFLIDANAIGHAAHRAQTLNYGGFQTQAPFSFAKLLRNLRAAFPNDSINLLWDGRAEHRFELLPGYKGARELKEQTDPEEKKSKDAYRAVVPVIRKMAELMGVRQIVHPMLEADDLAGFFCSHVLKGKRVRLVTGDTDWLQLLSEQVDWYDHRESGKLINLSNLLEHTGFHTPDEYLQGKALIGDTTDSIPGLDGFGKKTSVELLARFKSVQAFFDQIDAGSYSPKVRKDKNAKTPHPEQLLNSPEGRQLFERNMKLMDLRNPPQVDLARLQVTEGRLNLDHLKTLFGRLGFVSLLQNFDAWTTPLVVPSVASQQSTHTTKEAIPA